MQQGTVYRILKSDFGIITTMIGFIIAIVGPYYSIKTELALINQKLETTTETFKTIDSKNEDQDKAIGMTSNRISNVEGRLTTMGIFSKNYDINK